MPNLSVNERVQKYRNSLRASGLRPLQIWVPDTRMAGFNAECDRQSRLIAEAECKDTKLDQFMDNALSDTDGWTE
ncbi:antitoxin MazE family protein [Pusillimonas sp. MFBS29]|uniref:antitoxin MazE family protein n=1 Tax=Pusillimonas sp. MFBS29 TaxID=2886690 RepID=UPI001D0FE9FC|nr:antitoxin MazE family protein [Pusillimonas sp. MFBS29]MCC2595870.1 antitoxin MazE family protein [Pusillimonas sp. MFBS29]